MDGARGGLTSGWIAGADDPRCDEPPGVASRRRQLRGFHPLAGDRRGRYAVTVTGNYRATFRLEKRNIYDVHFLDYH
jgi:hypothetical protein